MAKKRRRFKKAAHAAAELTPQLGGLRDLAELLSAEYGLECDRVGWQTVPSLFNMDQLTAMLESVPPEIVERAIQTEFFKGFMMGMLHQTIVSDAVYQMKKDQEDGVEGPE